MPGITGQSVKERLEITYKAKAIFAFLSSETKDMADIWKLMPDGRTQYMDYRSGMSMTIAGRRFVLYDKTSDLNNLLFMLLGKNDPICSFFSRSGGMGVYVGFPDNTLYKVESIFVKNSEYFVTFLYFLYLCKIIEKKKNDIKIAKK